MSLLFATLTGASAAAMIFLFCESQIQILMKRIAYMHYAAFPKSVPGPLLARSMSTQQQVGKPPVLDMINIHDDPSKGFMARVVYKSGRLEFLHYPQLGQRKTDPMDPLPQFDMNAKSFYRTNRKDFCELIAVTTGKTDQAKISTAYGAKVELNRTPDGYVLHIDSPVGERGKDPSGNRECTLRFDNQYASAFRNFFEFALEKQFGFDKPVDQPAIDSAKTSQYSERQKVKQREKAKEEKQEVKVDELDDW